jgi:hypothetical protein
MEKDPINQKEEKKEEEKEEDIENIKIDYGYWKREGDLKDRDQFIPKPLDNKVNSNNENLTLKNKTSASAWNTAGTWEEKHYNKNKITEFFNSYLKQSKFNIDNKICNFSIKDYSGDCYTFFVRQKVKFVYDCNFKLEIPADGDLDPTEIEVKDVCNHDLDADFEFEFKKGSSQHWVLIKKNIKKVEGEIKKIFTAFFDSQKQ